MRPLRIHAMMPAKNQRYKWPLTIVLTTGRSEPVAAPFVRRSDGGGGGGVALRAHRTSGGGVKKRSRRGVSCAGSWLRLSPQNSSRAGGGEVDAFRGEVRAAELRAGARGGVVGGRARSRARRALAISLVANI
jgi:hypothetical protein